MGDRGTSSRPAARGRLLNANPVPALHREQVRRFTIQSLRARPARRFSAVDILDDLRANGGKTVIAVDIGGDKITASFFDIRDAGLRRGDEIVSLRSNGGAGYLDALRGVSEIARSTNSRVGISFAGPSDGTRLIAGPNLEAFIREFSAGFDGDFANLFPSVEVANDAEAGMMAGALEAARRYPDARDVIYVINGSGLGGAVLTGDTLYAAEPGHIPVVNTLNVFGQSKACGMDGATYVCIEAVAASKAGVEDIWRKRTGESLPGHEISARYLDGHQFAFDLYDNSAHVTAHAVRGMSEAFGLIANPGRLVVVGHGGIFQVPGYGDRLRQVLESDLEYKPWIIFTKDFSDNTCLEGAAIAVAREEF
jgi:predicted NBD/HSP70 family sugar kinase